MLFPGSNFGPPPEYINPHVKPFNYKQFSYYVSELTLMWLEWMKYNKIALDTTQPLHVREQAANKCEELISLEYKLTEQLDKYFE